MGVSGSGKSTVGSMLAVLLDVPILDADGLHPEANVAKMAAGTPLTDDDRWPWLARVGQELAGSPRGVVIACSALRVSYRSALRTHAPDAVFAHLHGTPERLVTRMTARLDHFMPASLLDTQLRTLDPLRADEAGLVIGVESPPDEIAADIAAWWRTYRARVPSPSARAR
jgi:carbohydrate kinase (thermoresistant glucokinase family)